MQSLRDFPDIIELEKIVAESMNKYKSLIFEKSKPNHKPESCLMYSRNKVEQTWTYMPD